MTHLNFGADSDELLLEVCLARRVQHFGLDLGRVGGPHDEQDLGLRASVVGKVVVKDSVAALVLGQLFQELVVGRVLGALMNDR
jgi:hypothetical protein